MAVTKTKIRPGSIPSGPGKGKFPITSQKSVQSAAKLIGHAKNVSRARVKAHVIAEAKKRGLKVPPSLKSDTKMANVELAHEYRYKHGWIPLGHGYHVDVQRPKLGGSGPETHHPVTGPDGAKIGHVTTVHRVRSYHTEGPADVGATEHKSVVRAAKAIKKKHRSKTKVDTKMATHRLVGDVELAEVHRYRHGWIPINPAATALKSKTGERGFKIPHPQADKGHYAIGPAPDGKHVALHYPKKGSGGSVSHLGRYDRPQDAEGAVNAHIKKTRDDNKFVSRKRHSYKAAKEADRLSLFTTSSNGGTVRNHVAAEAAHRKAAGEAHAQGRLADYRKHLRKASAHATAAKRVTYGK